VITAGDTLDETLAEAAEAAEALAFAAEGWADDTGEPFPPPCNLDDLRADTDFIRQSVDAVVAAVPPKTSAGQAA
jgi:hypothetical protein